MTAKEERKDYVGQIQSCLKGLLLLLQRLFTPDVLAFCGYHTIMH